MNNEKHKAICSVTGRECKCSSVDKTTTKDVRWLKAAVIKLEAAKDDLDRVQEDHLRTRAYPGPEVREVRRKIVTSISMLEEIIG